MGHALFQPHLFQQFSGALQAFFAGDAGKAHRKSHVLQCGHAGHQVERLEDETHRLAAIDSQIVLIHAVHRRPADNQAARCGPVQPADQVKQRAFTRPGRPHDHREGTPVDLQIQPGQRLHLLAAHGECFSQRLRANQSS